MNKTVANKAVKGNVIEMLNKGFSLIENDKVFEKEFNVWLKKNNIA